MDICDTCQKPIEGRIIMALGKSYHPEHFQCAVCKQPITDTSFHQQDGKPLCSRDYEATCPQCATCKQPITGRMVTAMGNSYHDAHFVCAMCSASLSGAEYHEQKGVPICRCCYLDKVAEKCKGCGEPIEKSAIVALNAKWHPACFKCKICNQSIKSQTFKVDNGTGGPICEYC